jgi:hypothetical protein
MDSIPTASITGKEDWEWNRLQDERRAAAQSPPTQSTEPRHEAPSRRPHRATAVEGTGTDRRRLVARLERKDQRLQAVITRYERLLENRDRELAEATTEPEWSSHKTSLVQIVRRLIASR